MSKAGSTSQLNVAENLSVNAQSSPCVLTDKKDGQFFLSPYLQRLRALQPQSYLFPRINKALQQASQSSEVNKTGRFFRRLTQPHQKGQKNKRKAADNNFLSVDNASDVALDISASLEVDIPSDQLNAMIQDLFSDSGEPVQKKIKIESPQP